MSRGQELAKPKDWGCPGIPLFFQVISSIIISNSCFSFIFVFSFVCLWKPWFISFLFCLVLILLLLYKTKTPKRFYVSYLFFIGFYLLLLCLLTKAKTTKRFSFFFAFYWFILGSCLLLFAFSFLKFSSLLKYSFESKITFCKNKVPSFTHSGCFKVVIHMRSCWILHAAI